MPKILNTGSGISFSTIQSYLGISSNISSARTVVTSLAGTTGTLSFSAFSNLTAPAAPQAWYDAMADFSVTTAGNNKIQQWRDKTTNKYHVSQNISAQQPTYSNTGFDGTRPAVLLTQGTALMAAVSNMGTLATPAPFTVYCVAEHNSAITFGNTVGAQSMSNGDLAPVTDRKFQLSLNNSNVTSNTAQLFGDKTIVGQRTYSGKCIQGLCHGGVNCNTYLLLNNTIPVSASNYNDIPSLTASGVQFMVGNNSNIAQNRNAPKSAEIMMYDRNLPLYERYSTERYLTEKWGMFPVNMAGFASSATGVYSPKRLVNEYKGPTIRLRRAVDNAELDFYSDCFGTLGTVFNGEGTSLLTWGSNMRLFVRTVYDQSGKGNHATQTTTAAQPFFDAANYAIDFGTTSTQFLTLTGTPLTSSSYAVIFRHGQLNNTTNGPFISAGSGSLTSLTIRTNATTSYAVDWGNGSPYVFGAVSSNLPNTVVVLNSAANATSGHVNGTSTADATAPSVSLSADPQYLGRDAAGNYLNGEVFCIIVANIASMPAESRICIENNLSLPSYPEKILNSFPTFVRYDATTIPASSTSVSSWASSHNDGASGRTAAGAGTTFPTYGVSNGYPEVQFNPASNHHFSINSLAYDWFNNNGGMTIAVCAKYNVLTSNMALFESTNSSSTNATNTIILRSASNTNNTVGTHDMVAQIYGGLTGSSALQINNNVMTGGLTNTDFHTYVATFSTSSTGSIVNMFIDGGIKDTDIDSANTYRNRTNAFNYIGRGVMFPRYFDGAVRELIIYKTALTDTEALTVAHALNAKWGLPRKYPPATIQATGSGTTVSTSLNDLPYGNGTYIVSASSRFNLQSGSSPWNAFDGSFANRWSSSNSLYLTGTGAYLGTQSTLVSGVAQPGEWLQIQLPESIVPSYFTLVEQNNINASSVVIAGSNDGVTWTTLYDAANRPNILANIKLTLEKSIPTSNSFSYFRYICRVRNGVSTLTYTTLYEFSIHGY